MERRRYSGTEVLNYIRKRAQRYKRGVTITDNTAPKLIGALPFHLRQTIKDGGSVLIDYCGNLTPYQGR